MARRDRTPGGRGLQTIRFGPICKAGVGLISKFSHPLGAREFRLRPPPCYNWRVLPYGGVQASGIDASFR